MVDSHHDSLHRMHRSTTRCTPNRRLGTGPAPIVPAVTRVQRLWRIRGRLGLPGGIRTRGQTRNLCRRGPRLDSCRAAIRLPHGHTAHRITDRYSNGVLGLALAILTGRSAGADWRIYPSEAGRLTSFPRTL